MTFPGAAPTGYTADHSRLRNLDANDHPQYAMAEHSHPSSERVVESGRVAASESTTSTSFTDLTSSGPTASLHVPSSGRVRVTLTAKLRSNTASTNAYMGVDMAGANEVSASIDRSLQYDSGDSSQLSYMTIFTGLVPGLTTFTAKYRTDVTATATFSNREIIVEAL